MRHRSTCIALALILLSGRVFAQSLSGTVAGSVSDESGGVLPGATVTLEGKTGSRTTTADSVGTYRFVAVDPGSYRVTAGTPGFQAASPRDIAVGIGALATVDFSLKVAASSAVEVVAQVDSTSSATHETLSQDMLSNLPIRPMNPALDLLNTVPGVNGGSAFGGDAGTGNALLIDGVDTRDPDGGLAWTYYNFNVVEEVQVSGLGAPAEYGAFTGAVVNTLTRSGGNQFGGLFDALYTNRKLASDNVRSSTARQNPSLLDPAQTTQLIDVTTQLSGPLIKDKLFFFGSAERFKLVQDPSGPRTARTEICPRLNLKLTYQPSPNDNVTGTFQADDYNVIGHSVYGLPEQVTTDELTQREDSPELVWMTQWRHIFGTKTFGEIKYTGWTGYYDLNPELSGPGHFDGSTGLHSVSAGKFYSADRSRHQANATLSRFAEGFGKHDFKFGVEIERSKVRSRYGYVDGLAYYDLTGYAPGQLVAYEYGYDVRGENQRESAYVQDAWKISDRLTLNPGARLDWIRGYSPLLRETVYDTKNLAPRVGFSYALDADHRTVLRGHYGRYYEGVFFHEYAAATPGVQDFVLYAFDPVGSRCGPAGNCFSEIDRSRKPIYRVDPEIKHPRTDEWTFGVEKALRSGLRAALTAVHRNSANVQGSVNPSARWSLSYLENDLTGRPAPSYIWANRSASEQDLVLTNPDGFEYRDSTGVVIGRAKATRSYDALMLVLSKTFSSRWQAQASYVLSRSRGTIDNGSSQAYGASYGASVEFETPTRALVNADGRLTNDRTHELKVYGTYQVPRIDLGVNLAYRAITGPTYTPFQQYAIDSINFVSSVTGRQVRLEPRGSRRLPLQQLMDLRLEKIVTLGRAGRMSAYANISNLLNAGTAIVAIDRTPSQAIAGVEQDVSFGAPGAIVAPRQVTLGARWSF